MAVSPNIILIVMDTVRADHLSCYGYDKNTTPAIDAIANSNILFENAFANSNWTPTSHGTIFSGYLPSETGIYGDRHKLPKRKPTIMEQVKSAGYTTQLSNAGAWITRDNGYARGVDDFIDANNYTLDYGLDDLSKFINDKYHRRQIIFDVLSGPNRRTEAKFEKLADFVMSSDGPSFSFLNTKVAHNPYDPPRPYKERFDDSLNRPRFQFITFLRRKFGLPGESTEDEDMNRLQSLSEDYPIIANAFEPTENELEIIRSWYDGSIRYIDEKISELKSKLQRSNQWDETTLIITSDHGELFGEHGLEKHYYGLYDELLRVPLIIKPDKNHNVGHHQISDMISLVDLNPTILELAGVPSEKSNYSQSLLPFNVPVTHEKLFAEVAGKYGGPISRRHPEFDGSDKIRPLQSIRTSEWKLVTDRTHDTRLYSWRGDPKNIDDKSDENPKITGILEDSIQNELSDISDSFFGKYNFEPDDDTVERLKKLGYR